MTVTQLRALLPGLLALLFAVFALAPSAAAQAARPGDVAIGSADAPVTVIEFVSLNCLLCAQFHTETMPGIFTKYIETGKVRFIYRDFPQDNVGLGAAMVTQCLDDRLHYGFVQMLFKQLEKWTSSDDPVGAVARLARIAGLSEDRAAACLSDTELRNSIIASQNAASQEFQITVPPSFIIGGELIAGVLSLSDFEDLIEPLLN